MGRFRDILSEGVLGRVGLVQSTRERVIMKRIKEVMRARNFQEPGAFSSSAGVNSGFDGGAQRRRLATWKPTQLTVNTLISSQGPLLRARCRDVLRNNPLAVAACESYVGNLIGTGMKPSWLMKDAGLKKAAQELWADWTTEADADDATDFYGMQAAAAHAMFEAGECFIRFRSRREEDDLAVPLQLEMLESEMCPYWLNQQADNGNYIMNGIEFDLRNRRVAYWFFTQHPGDAPVDQQNINQLRPVRVPADQVVHIFRPTRPGQVRGIPLIAPSLVRMFFLDQYDDAELERKKIAALFAGFVTSSTPEDILPVDVTTDAETPSDEGIGLTGLEPGTLQTLLPGEDIKFSEPADVGGSYEMFHYRQQLAIFSGTGTPYMLATGDTRRASYSSLRGVMIEFRRRLEPIQYSLIVHKMCRPIAKRWMTDAVISGALDIKDFAENRRVYVRARWIAPAWELADPLKDRQAEKLAVDAGFKARSDVVEEGGYDAEENDDRIAADKAREERLGLEFPVATAAASQPATDPQEQADANQNLSGEEAAA